MHTWRGQAPGHEDGLATKVTKTTKGDAEPQRPHSPGRLRTGLLRPFVGRAEGAAREDARAIASRAPASTRLAIARASSRAVGLPAGRPVERPLRELRVL